MIVVAEAEQSHDVASQPDSQDPGRQAWDGMAAAMKKKRRRFSGVMVGAACKTEM